jgi:lysophospholipase L1-like esterase
MLRVAAAALACLIAGSAAAAPLAPLPASARVAGDVNAFAAQDVATPPPPCPLLFEGSSSIRRWTTLAADMKPYAVLNRGFGGSQISDVNAYFDRVVAPYRPRAIVFYAGDNDIHAGKTPDDVVADFKAFMALKRKALGHTRVYFISLKPSPSRLAEYPAQEDVNRQVKAMAETQHDLAVIDVVGDMMDEGKPKDIFVADGLHLAPAGYAIWTKDVRRVLDWTGADKLRCAAPKPK